MNDLEVENRTKPLPKFPIVKDFSDEQYIYFCKGFKECWDYVNKKYKLYERNSDNDK